ncbi:MAG: GNAT family N-acetyltransferase [Gemmatimonadaceae bacterium]
MSAIEPVGLDKVDAFLAHVIATGASSGTGGVPRFHPDPDAAIRPSYRATLLDQLSRRLDEPGWRRVWGVWHGGSLIAQAELRGGAVEAALHRATLGMTMLPTHHGQGLGRALLAHIIAWARTAGLAWIDLGVFVENAPARRLYARAGFVETGQLKDVFRIGGVSVDDVRMTLDLRGPGM